MTLKPLPILAGARQAARSLGLLLALACPGIAVAAIEVTPEALAPSTVGQPYRQVLDASGGAAPYRFEVSAGELPPGLTLAPDGTLAGVPIETGDNSDVRYAFNVTATDANGDSGQREYTLRRIAVLVQIGPHDLPAATLGEQYNGGVTASGGVEPYTWTITEGGLPPGLSLVPDGGDTVRFSGIPSEVGVFGFTLRATGRYGAYWEEGYILDVLAAREFDFQPESLPEATLGVPYGVEVVVTGGATILGYEITGDLPPGIDFSAAGRFHGTPTAAGEFPVVVTAVDQDDRRGQHAYVLSVANADIALAPATLPAAEAGSPYHQTLTATGGTAPYSFAVTDGALPAGLSLDGEGILSGVPEAAGTYAFAVTATDAFDQAGTQDYALDVSTPPLPDPTKDPDVAGLLASQATAVRAFGTTQIRNVQRHLETLHGGGSPGWRVWFGGSIRSGDRDATGSASPLSFETAGVTAGVDYRFDRGLVSGAALGYARDRSTVGNRGSRNDGEAPSGAWYFGWHPEARPYFLDGLVGYQSLAFDVRRIGPDGAKYLSRRHGEQAFTSWQGGVRFVADALLVVPFVRVDAARARLDGFREHGNDPLALSFGRQDVDLRTTTLGLRVQSRLDTAWGEWVPRLRLEYQRDFHDQTGVSIRYANQVTSPVFFSSPTELDDDRFVLELGSLFRTHWKGLIVGIDYVGIHGGANEHEHGLTFSLQEE